MCQHMEPKPAHVRFQCKALSGVYLEEVREVPEVTTLEFVAVEVDYDFVATRKRPPYF